MNVSTSPEAGDAPLTARDPHRQAAERYECQRQDDERHFESPEACRSGGADSHEPDQKGERYRGQQGHGHQNGNANRLDPPPWRPDAVLTVLDHHVASVGVRREHHAGRDVLAPTEQIVRRWNEPLPRTENRLRPDAIALGANRRASGQPVNRAKHLVAKSFGLVVTLIPGQHRRCHGEFRLRRGSDVTFEIAECQCRQSLHGCPAVQTR